MHRFWSHTTWIWIYAVTYYLCDAEQINVPLWYPVFVSCKMIIIIVCHMIVVKIIGTKHVAQFLHIAKCSMNNSYYYYYSHCYYHCSWFYLRNSRITEIINIDRMSAVNCTWCNIWRILIDPHNILWYIISIVWIRKLIRVVIRHAQSPELVGGRIKIPAQPTLAAISVCYTPVLKALSAHSFQLPNPTS